MHNRYDGQVVCEAATGHIYRLPGENQFDMDQYRTYMDQLQQLGKVPVLNPLTFYFTLSA